MKLFYCLSSQPVHRFLLFQPPRLTYDVEGGDIKSKSSFIPVEGQYLVDLRERVEKAEKGPDKSTDPQVFFADLIGQVDTLKKEAVSKAHLDSGKSEDKPYIERLEASAKFTREQINEARDRFVRNQDYLRFAAEAKVGIDNATQVSQYWEKNTDFSNIRLVFGYLKHTADMLYDKRNLLIGTNPTNDLTSEKEALLTDLSNGRESLQGLSKALIGRAEAQVHQHDELISAVKTDETPDPVKIRALQTARNDFQEALNNSGTNLPEELKPFVVGLAEKIQEIKEVIEEGRSKFVQNSPELAEKYESLGKTGDELDNAIAKRNAISKDPNVSPDEIKGVDIYISALQKRKEVDKADFQLTSIHYETGPLLEKVAIANPPSLHDIRTLQAYLNNSLEIKTTLEKNADKKDLRITQVIQKSELLVKTLEGALNKAKEVYIKSAGDPAYLKELLARGADLKKQIIDHREKMVKAASEEETQELLKKLDELHTLQEQNNDKLQGTLNEIERNRLVNKLSQDDTVLYGDIIDLQQLNVYDDENISNVIRNAQKRFIDINPGLKPLAESLARAHKVYKDAQDIYKKLQAKDPNDPARKFAEKKLNEARDNYFKKRNEFVDQATHSDEMIGQTPSPQIDGKTAQRIDTYGAKKG